MNSIKVCNDNQVTIIYQYIYINWKILKINAATFSATEIRTRYLYNNFCLILYIPAIYQQLAASKQHFCIFQRSYIQT